MDTNFLLYVHWSLIRPALVGQAKLNHDNQAKQMARGIVLNISLLL